jgi:hypothetical protein
MMPLGTLSYEQRSIWLSIVGALAMALLGVGFEDVQ